MTEAARAKAIEYQRARKQANRDNLVTAINDLRRRSQPINVQSVARAAGVHPDTLRRNPDLLAEVRHLRETQGVPVGSRIPVSKGESGQSTALRAQLVAARDEIAGLRSQLARAMRAAHQELGTSGTSLTAEEAAELNQHNAELQVRLTHLHDQVTVLKDERNSLVDELTAAHDLNRQLTRDLNTALEGGRASEQQLSRLRRDARP